jgi:cardiolipin synthase
MTAPPSDLAALANDWCAQLPGAFIGQLAEALRAGNPAVKALRSTVVQPSSSAALATATRLCAQGEGPYLAGLLVGQQHAREQQATITPVWTGPTSAVLRDRLTLAVLSDLIAEAQHELLLVSYATTPSASTRTSLAQAETRGVRLTLLLERPADNSGFRGRNDPLPELRGVRLHWPSQARPHEASMHAKLLVIDRRTALVGSANLTGYGLERNLECGVLIRGGPVPGLLAEHVLTADGLAPLPNR